MRTLTVMMLAVLATICEDIRPLPGTTATDVKPDITVTTTSTDPGQRLSHATRQLLASVKITSYAHRTVIDESTGSYVTDCSGMLTWLLKRELPEHLSAIPNKRGRTHPLAADFQEAFVANVTGWQRIMKVQDVHPGDVFAWRYQNPKPGKSTGHVVVIDSDAALVSENIFSVTIIDSTSAPHDDDTRTDSDGIGRGTIQLRVDGDGAPVAVLGNAQSTFREYIFAIARPVK